MNKDNKIITLGQFPIDVTVAQPLLPAIQQPAKLINLAEHISGKCEPIRALALDALRVGDFDAFNQLDKQARHYQRIETAALDFKARRIMSRVLNREDL